MVKPTEWTAADIRYLEANYWDQTYAEIADVLGMSTSVVHRKAKDDLELPEKTEKNRVKYTHGVPIERILYHLHHDAELSVNKMSNALDVSRKTLDRWFKDAGVHKRGRSEAERLKWSQMSEQEREQQVRAAHEKTRELAEDGEHAFQRWYREHPEAARRHARQAGALGAPARDRNGMEGVTGQDHPKWRGGKSIYDAVKKQLPGPSWQTRRKRHLANECRRCGETNRLELHHIIPLMVGGTNGAWNLMTLCPSCHHLAEWYMRRITDPVLTR